MSVGPMDNNTYLVTCAKTGESLLIDAANDPELLVELVGEHAPKLALILTTHQHFDHWRAWRRWPRPPAPPLLCTNSTPTPAGPPEPLPGRRGRHRDR